MKEKKRKEKKSRIYKENYLTFDKDKITEQKDVIATNINRSSNIGDKLSTRIHLRKK